MFLVKALDLAAQATEHAQFKDWWWKVQLGKCYYRQAAPHYLCYSKKGLCSFINASDLCRLGLYREAEKQFRSALNHQEIVDTYLYLAKVVALNCDLFCINTHWKHRIAFEWNMLVFSLGVSALGSADNSTQSFQTRSGPLPWGGYAPDRDRSHTRGKILFLQIQVDSLLWWAETSVTVFFCFYWHRRWTTSHRPQNTTKMCWSRITPMWRL